ncbi:molybdenum cofactor guanylyltransferase [Thermodesulfobacteriota bacterium]
MNRSSEVTGVILAGGRSRRFGSDKTFAEIAGKSFIERVSSILTGLFENVIIVGRDPIDFEGLGTTAVSDALPDLGALGGIYTGLLYAATPYIFVAACDMPLLNPKCVRIILDRAAGYDIVVPWLQDGQHPLHAAYSRKCIPHMERAVKEGELKVISLLQELRTLKLTEADFTAIDPNLNSFLNINTQDDYKRALRLIEETAETREETASSLESLTRRGQ